jgi:hypothetical protein
VRRNYFTVRHPGQKAFQYHRCFRLPGIGPPRDSAQNLSVSPHGGPDGYRHRHRNAIVLLQQAQDQDRGLVRCNTRPCWRSKAACRHFRSLSHSVNRATPIWLRYWLGIARTPFALAARHSQSGIQSFAHRRRRWQLFMWSSVVETFIY